MMTKLVQLFESYGNKALKHVPSGADPVATRIAVIGIALIALGFAGYFASKQNWVGAAGCGIAAGAFGLVIYKNSPKLLEAATVIGLVAITVLPVIGIIASQLFAE